MSVAGLIGGAQDPRETRSALENVGVGTAGTPGDLEDLIVAIAKMAEGKPPQVAFAERDGILPTSTDIAKATGVKENPLYQMFAMDPTGGLGKAAKGAKFMDDIIGAMVLAHGTPHMWKGNKADISKVGTGEGAQAYGHGLYFAENPRVAKDYQQRLSVANDGDMARASDIAYMYGMDNKNLSGDELSDFANDATHSYVTGNLIDEYKDIHRKFKQAGIMPGDEGNLYTVDVPDEEIARMLDWDAPLSEQPESVRQKIMPMLEDYFKHDKNITDPIAEADALNWRGETLYERFGGGSDPEYASNRLNELGIPGIRYLDGTSRSAGEGTRNVVKFGDDNITTLTRNGEPVYRDEPLGAPPQNPPTPEMNPRSAEYKERAGLKHPVAGGLVMTEPLHELTRSIANSKIAPEIPRTIEDLQGRTVMGLAGDRSDAGTLVNSIAGQNLINPIETQGGRGYMRLEPGQAWASGGNIPSKLRNKAQGVIDETGEMPLGVYTTMGHDSANFNHMVTSAALDLIEQADLPASTKKAFDESFSKAWPDFVGLDSPGLQQQLANNGGMRRAFNDTLSTAAMKKQGFPDMGKVRAGLTDPKLIDVPNNMSGMGIAELTGSLIDNPKLKHGTYDKVLEGEYFGDMDPVHRNVLFRDWWKGRPPASAAAHGRSFEWGSPTQKIDQQLVDAIMGLQGQ